MQTFFECKVQYLKVNESGYERKATGNYLIDAVSFTDAETRITEKMKEITSRDFKVKNIKQSNIVEVFPYEEGEWWYKAKISMVSIDEEAGKEKKITSYALVMADDIEQANKRLIESFSYLLVSYTIVSISRSNIADVFPYFELKN